MKEQNFQEEVMKILEEIPKARSALVENYDNLLNVAEYCNSNYIQSGDGSMTALEETKNFTTQSLASVAYQISTLASSILSLLDAQTNQLGHMESSINLIGQKVEMHKEKVSRREIGIFTAVRRVPRTHNILPPTAPQPRPPYSRRPINYKQLDGIGHSMKVSGKQLDRPGTLRKHGASIRSCKPTESVQCPVAPPVISSSFGKPVAPPTIPTTGLAPLECDIITTLLDEAPPPLTAAEISTQNVKVADTSFLPPPLPPPASSRELMAPPPPPLLPASSEEMVTLLPPPPASSGEMVAPPPPPPLVASLREMVTPSLPPTVSSGELVVLPPPPAPPASSGEMMAPPPPPLLPASSGEMVAPPPLLPASSGEMMAPTPPPPPLSLQLNGLTNHSIPLHAPPLFLETVVEENSFPSPSPPPPPSDEATLTTLANEGSEIPTLPPPPNQEIDDLEILAPPPSFLMDDEEGFEDIMPPLPPPVEYDTDPPPKYLDKVVALYNYEASRPDDLSITEGDIIYLMHRHSDGWCEGILHGNKGFFPENYVQSCSSVVAPPTHKSHANEKN